MEDQRKRYALEKLIDYDPDTGTETWVTIMQSNDIETLKQFLVRNHRIIDRQTGGYGTETLRGEMDDDTLS